jgi:signal transduction histidine kinase/streptogramin lyase
MGRNFFQFRTIQDHSGLLWHATRPNIYKQSPKTRQIETIRHQTNGPGSIPSDTITSLFEDSKNRLWVGTSLGLSFKENGDEKFKELKINLPTKNADPGYIKIVYEDAAGTIWVGTYGKGLLRFNEKDMSLREISLFPNSDQLGHSYDIEAIREDASGNLWISVWRKGIYILEKSSYNLKQKFETSNWEEHNMKGNLIVSIYLDSRDNIWLGDNDDNDIGLYKYLPEEKKFKHYSNNPSDSLSLINNEVIFIAEDDRNRLWIGTDGGLSMFDEEKDFFYNNNEALKMPSTTSYAQAGNGQMWVATYSGGGLALVGPNIEETEFFGEEEGLLHNDISAYGEQLYLDGDGLLWLPTQRGLSVFDTESRTFNNYDTRDGVQNYASRSCLLITGNGNIWIGGQNGLNKIAPEMLFKKDSIPPQLAITSMGINDSIYRAPDGALFKKSVSYTEQVTLDHTQRDLSFEFVALHFLRPEDNLYSWKLENYDTDWSAPSKERKASYTNLSPGEYTFRVKGSNADGIWNEEGASIHITIAPPWWQTWWAYSIYFLLLLYIGYRVHLYQKARTIKKAQEEAQKKELAQAKEIKKAYAELKATQTQLIQAEKMASLGELTAGIAHEIQNPLNFVNNFSEVNRELIEELKEEKAKTKKARDESLEEELLTDIDQNLEKISHHGKRADSIVKGMLQHSRASSGEKEPTDINVLADEYLRLAYHGLRAKDKSFNAIMNTDFDKKIGKINVIPQDMGRVILNLITNAFHAVQERKKQGEEGYEPTVAVITKKVGDTIQIEVKDNGNGIPKKIIQKIFEPFFTTKPSGRGTGLGLSMSYEIVTKGHKGELKVNSKEGEGTTFTIELPIVKETKKSKK